MSDDTKAGSGLDRRRFIKGAGAGVAIAWTAPIITGMNARAFAAGSCAKGTSVFQFVVANATPNSGTDLVGPFLDSVNGTTLTVTQGNVDVVGPGTQFVAGFPPVRSLDLTGGQVTLTVLEGPILAPGAYFVELDVYGSVTGGTGTNRALVKIGGETIVDSGFPADDFTQLFSFGSSTGSSSGLLSIRHTGDADFRGLFLKRLEVFAAIC